MFISTGVWRDLTDGHLYREGEPFPFDGREIRKERLDRLAGSGNRAGYPLIRAAEVQNEPKDAPKEEMQKTAGNGRKTAAKKPRAKTVK